MSNTERDELMRVFAGQPVSLGPKPKQLMTGHAQEIADKILTAGYRKTPTIPTQMSAWLINEHRVSWDEQGIGSCRRCGPLDGALESWEHQARILAGAGADASRKVEAT